VAIGGQIQTFDMQPREEKLLPVPIEPHRPAVLIEVSASSGFRPSETEPGSTDTRFLGVWLEVR
jgi:hypothetical protein